MSSIRMCYHKVHAFIRCPFLPAKLHARNTSYSDRACENGGLFANKSSEGTEGLSKAVSQHISHDTAFT